MNEIVEMRAVFKGKVQGVFFRATTEKYAKSLGLAGTVKNLPNGNVEAIAQGPRKRCEELVNNLKADAGYGEVEDFEVSFHEPLESFEQFHIIR